MARKIALLALAAALLAASHTADAFTAPAAIALRAPSRPLVRDRCARVLPRRRNASRDSPAAAARWGAKRRAGATCGGRGAHVGASASATGCYRILRQGPRAAHGVALGASAALFSARPATCVTGRRAAARHACAPAYEGPGRPFAHDVPLACHQMSPRSPLRMAEETAEETVTSAESEMRQRGVDARRKSFFSRF